MVRIRLAREVDGEAITAIYAPFVESTAVSFETVAPAREEMIRRVVETTTIYPWLVCEFGGTVAGYAYATQHRARAAYRWSVDTSVYVDAAHRRCGIGRGLYTSLLGILRTQGFFNVYAGITLPNAASVTLHEAVGFKKLGVYQRVGYKLDMWHDVGWWQLVLRDHSAPPDEPIVLPTLLGTAGWDNLVGAGEELVYATGA